MIVVEALMSTSSRRAGIRARDHHRVFFGAPIETSISPIRGEMPALRRLTGGDLTSFTAGNY
jgi:hypothetical protein